MEKDLHFVGVFLSVADNLESPFMSIHKTVVFLILSVSSLGKTAGQLPCRTTRSVPDYALKGHVISSPEGKRLESCVAVCDSINNCFSINYYISSKKCELNNKTAKWYANDLRVTPGAVYLDILSRDYTPCFDRNPPCSAGKCVPIPGSLATRCLCDGNAAACHNKRKSSPKMEEN